MKEIERVGNVMNSVVFLLNHKTWLEYNQSLRFVSKSTLFKSYSARSSYNEGKDIAGEPYFMST